MWWVQLIALMYQSAARTESRENCTGIERGSFLWMSRWSQMLIVACGTSLPGGREVRTMLASLLRARWGTTLKAMNTLGFFSEIAPIPCCPIFNHPRSCRQHSCGVKIQPLSLLYESCGKMLHLQAIASATIVMTPAHVCIILCTCPCACAL